MSKFIAVLGAGVLGVTMFSANAEAQCGSGYGTGYSYGGYAAPSYGYGRYGYSPQIRSYSNYNYGSAYGYGGYHNTSHYDYHAPSVYQHRGHFDVQPGHYDVHRSGHRHH